jgi:hypothetical protein
MMTPQHSLALEVEPDCIHWLPDVLDPEPEPCFCLSFGKALPCSACLSRTDQTNARKEFSHAL